MTKHIDVVGYLMVTLLFALCCCILAARAQGQAVCHPSDATYTEVLYVPEGNNTAVKLRAWCETGSSEWYVSFFVGDQPTLREYAEIQNTASRLLRD